MQMATFPCPARDPTHPLADISRENGPILCHGRVLRNALEIDVS